MTTFTTKTEPMDGPGRRGLLGATALTLLVVGAAALWLVRPAVDAPTVGDAAHGTTGRASAPAVPRGALRDEYPEMAMPDGAAPSAPGARSDAEMYQGWRQAADAAAGEAAPPVDVPALTDGAGHTLVVASPADIPDAYARFVERLRALDGSTPVAVTVVVGGASGDCGASVGPAAC